jgi:hypothetical protein
MRLHAGKMVDCHCRFLYPRPGNAIENVEQNLNNYARMTSGMLLTYTVRLQSQALAINVHRKKFLDFLE